MPTDKEKLKALLTEFGLSFEAPDQPCTPDNFIPPGATAIKLETRHHAKVEGYMGFYCEFIFDTEGKFNHLGIWE